MMAGSGMRGCYHADTIRRDIVAPRHPADESVTALNFFRGVRGFFRGFSHGYEKARSARLEQESAEREKQKLSTWLRDPP
jgi:hypothetical protein